MTRRQLFGRKLLLRFFLASLFLTLITHGAILILCPRWESFVLFLPGNAFYLVLFVFLFYTGDRALHWIMVYVFLLRGGLELFLFARIENLKIASQEDQLMVPAFSETGSLFLKCLGVPMALSMICCGLVIVLVPSVRDFLAFQRLTRGQRFFR